MKNVRVRLVACPLLAFGLAVFSSAQGPPPPVPPDSRFEVATIKPGIPGEYPGIRILVAFTRVETSDTSVTDLIKYAYSVHPDQISGGPDGLMHRGYAIQATINAEKPNVEVLRQMIRTFLQIAST